MHSVLSIRAKPTFARASSSWVKTLESARVRNLILQIAGFAALLIVVELQGAPSGLSTTFGSSAAVDLEVRACLDASGQCTCCALRKGMAFAILMAAWLCVIKSSLPCSECPWQTSTSTCRGDAASGLPWLLRCSGLWAASSKGQGQPLTVQEPRCRADMLTAKDVSRCFTASWLLSHALNSLGQQCSRGNLVCC